LAVTLVINGPFSKNAEAQVQGGEYAVKAAYLLNFAKYAEWSTSLQRASTEAFTICLWQKDPLGGASEELRKRRLGDRQVIVKVVTSADQLSPCDLAFFVEQFDSDVPALASTLEKERVLTVTEKSLLGILNFQNLNGKVKFDCNLDAARRSGIKLGSQLLKLAEQVKGEIE
jgi:hypothetical protein